MLDNDEQRETGHKIAQGTHKQKKLTFIARRVIVKLAPPEEESTLEDETDAVMAEAEGAQVLRPAGKTGRMVVLIPEGESVPSWSKRLESNERVLYAEPDVVDRAQVVPNDARYPDQWAPPIVNAETGWDLETGDTNVLIGIIDSGISMTGGALDHDDLSTPGRFTLGTDFVDGGTPQDLNGHGTHVAGIAAGAGNNLAGIAGMNWGSPVYICRTLDANGNGSSADFADAVEEITDFAVAHGQRAVINYSGGGAANQTKQDACQYASDNGMLVVAATGNDNAGPVIWPAAYSTTITGVIGVGSTDSDDTVSGFSNVGPEVTVVAPGGSILSTTPTYVVRPTLPVNYGTMSGTSMATPLVTGLAALMWSRHPGFTNQKIKVCLQDTAINLGSGEFDNSWGHGRVDALAALKCGDLIVIPSAIGRTCPPKTRLIVECLPKTAICPRTYLSICPSRLPLLCPNTALRYCWSQLLCVEPTTNLAVCQVNTMICPSAVDACPSAPGGCLDPIRDPIQPIMRRLSILERRLDEMKTEVWYGEDEEGTEKAGWFYVDDSGDIHEA